MNAGVMNELPQDLYEQIQQLASARHTAVGEEMVRLLRLALQQEEGRRALHAAILDDLRRKRWTPPPGTPASLKLLREDRER